MERIEMVAVDGWYWTRFSDPDDIGPIIVEVFCDSGDITVEYDDVMFDPEEFIGFWGPIACPDQLRALEADPGPGKEG
jgi:hypothetical protein